MSRTGYGNVILWNQQRRFAKRVYTQRVISALDASGYINQVLKDNIKRGMR